MNKKKLFVFSLLLIAGVLAACGTAEPEGCLGNADDAIHDLECQEITIVVENNYLPFNYVDLEDGVAKGWDYDAITEICTRLHCTPVYVEAQWEGMIQGIADGQWDVAADGITITEERDEIIDFSIGYVSTEQRLLVRIDEDRISDIQDIVDNPDLILGTQSGTTNYEVALNYLPEDAIKTYDQFPFVIQALIAGDIDAVIIDETAGLGYQGENADEVKLVGESMSSDVLGFAFPEGSELVQYFNMALESMIADGFMNDLNTRYFGPDFTITYDDVGPGAYGEEE